MANGVIDLPEVSDRAPDYVPPAPPVFVMGRCYQASYQAD
jgi:hypothetical protein